MTAIRVIFDGKAFIPQEPVSLPDRSEAVVIIEDAGPAARADLDAAVVAYYQAAGGEDGDDAAWAQATARQSHRAWDKD